MESLGRSSCRRDSGAGRPLTRPDRGAMHVESGSRCSRPDKEKWFFLPCSAPRRSAAMFLLAAIALSFSLGCSVLSDTASVPPKHPEDRAAHRADCRECHEDVSTGALKPYATFRHSIVFIRQHPMYAQQGQNLCAACHAPSFCQTCHVRDEEMKPSTKMGDRPDRVLQHRGDYIVLHQVDGRLDPGSCFRCHGNKNDAKCRACHR